jgi:hypothetical protein
MQVEKFLEQGKKLLAAGQLSDALTQYHAAVGMYIILEQVFCFCCLLFVQW